MSGWRDYRKGGRKDAAPDPAQKLQLLIVDDEERILESLSALLSDRYVVLTARGGDEALRLFKEKRPQLVLTDQRMPGRSGIELLKEMREIEPGSIRMLITGYSDIEVVIQAVNEQILHRYITKPWANEELLAAVEEAAGRYLMENRLAGGEPEILF